MNRPLFTFGPTLARRMSHEAAYGAICTAIQHGKVCGHVNIAVVRTERPDRLDVEATFLDLAPTEALDAIQIAAARIGVVHKVPASNAVAIGADDADALRHLAERLVDKHRAFGWWEKIGGWLGSSAEFKYGRESCVRELMQAIALWRPREVETPVGQVRGRTAEECAADEIPGVKSRGVEAPKTMDSVA